MHFIFEETSFFYVRLSLSRSFADAECRADSDTTRAHVFRSAFREEVSMRFVVSFELYFGLHVYILHAFAVVKILDRLREK